jgi:hypothetical protein
MLNGVNRGKDILRFSVSIGGGVEVNILHMDVASLV